MFTKAKIEKIRKGLEKELKRQTEPDGYVVIDQVIYDVDMNDYSIKLRYGIQHADGKVEWQRDMSIAYLKSNTNVKYICGAFFSLMLIQDEMSADGN